jgi:hypothetical protein
MDRSRCKFYGNVETLPLMRQVRLFDPAAQVAMVDVVAAAVALEY